MAIERHDNESGERRILHVIAFIGSLVGIGMFIFPNVEYGPKVSPTEAVPTQETRTILDGQGTRNPGY